IRSSKTATLVTTPSTTTPSLLPWQLLIQPIKVLTEYLLPLIGKTLIQVCRSDIPTLHCFLRSGSVLKDLAPVIAYGILKVSKGSHSAVVGIGCVFRVARQGSDQSLCWSNVGIVEPFNQGVRPQRLESVFEPWVETKRTGRCWSTHTLKLRRHDIALEVKVPVHSLL